MKKCIKCGKNFSNDDKRVKKCDACRFGDDKDKKMQEIENVLRANTERLTKIYQRKCRQAVIKKIVIISILVLVEIANIVLIFTK